MARYISEPLDLNNTSFNTSIIRPVGFLGVFGNGFFYYDTGQFDFTVKQNTKGSVRLRCVGRGGNEDDGGGGGYCHGVFDALPGDVLNCFIDETSSRVLLNGNTLLEAFAANGSTGGTATGGDFQADGGDGETGLGGASGSQLGTPYETGNVPYKPLGNLLDDAIIRFPFDGFSTDPVYSGQAFANTQIAGGPLWGNGGSSENFAGIGGGHGGAGIVIIEW